MERWTKRTAVLSAAASAALWCTATRAGAATTPTTANPATQSAGSSLIGSHNALAAAGIALGFGLLAIGLVLAFLLRDRQRSLDTIVDLAQKGVAVDTVAASSLAGEGRAPMLAPAGPAIHGPDTAAVGAASMYQVEPAPPSTDVAWTIGQGSAVLAATTGTATALTPTAAGKVVVEAALTSTGEGGVTTSLQLPITAVATATRPTLADRISVLGDGYGSVVIALGVASVTAALGLTDVLNGEAVATILGSLVTYSIVRATSGAGSSSSSAGGSSNSQNAPPSAS